MQLPKIAIKNAQFILILILIAVVLGVQSFLQMPRSEDPNIKLPIYTIVVAYPGTSPEDMEELIVDPIETVVDEVDDITEMLSEIEEGLAVIQIEGDFSIDADDQYDEIVREVNTIRPSLPDGIQFFEIRQFEPEDRTVIHQYALASDDAAYAHMLDQAEELEERLEDIEELKAVEVKAYPEEEARVSLDFQRMANQNISLRQVVGTLQQNNANIPGGDVQSRDKTFTIKTTGGYETLEEIRNTVVHSVNGKIVYLRDIAEVRMDYEDPRWMARHNRKRSVLLTINLKEGANILRVSEKIKAVEAEFLKQLPRSMKLYTAFEQAPAVQGRIQDFFFNLLQGVLLVGVVILLFLGWRAAIIIMTVIPLCVIIALALLNGAGYALQQISIAALVIALGLLVDNGIVVIENIKQFVKQGWSIREAAAKGTGEVGYAIISSTVTTLLAFFPLTQLGEGPGEFLRSLPLTVMFTLIISLILALTLSPILAGRLLNSKSATRSSRIERMMERIVAKVYRPVLGFALRRAWIIVVLGFALFGFALSLFPSIGVSFFPTADKPMLLINVNTPNGTNLDGADEAVSFVEGVLDTMGYVEDYTANVGHGNPLVYYNRIPEEFKKTHGQVLVNFTHWEPERFYSTLARLRRDFADYPGARITFSELKNGAPFEAPIVLRIIGENQDTLKRIAYDIEQVFESTQGVINVDNPLRVDKTQLQLQLNTEKAGLVNLTYLDYDQTVRASLTGLRIDNVSLEDGDDEEYPLVVRMPFDKEPSIDDFSKVYVATRAGGQVPLEQVTEMNFKAASSEIRHFNLDQYAVVTGDVVDADQTTAITQRILNKLENYDLPDGYRFYAAGEYENQQTAFGDLGIILVLAMVAIFAVLVLQFQSVLQPLVVLSAIPLAVTGSFVALYLTGWSFSFFAFVGFISLVGIVVNNSIIMVDYINQLLKEDGIGLVEAIRRGCERRFTPIVLTTVTTILGLFPLTASGTSLWSPLGWTIIGGMISSTLLTLLVVPVLYRWFTRA